MKRIRSFLFCMTAVLLLASCSSQNNFEDESSSLSSSELSASEQESSDKQAPNGDIIAPEITFDDLFDINNVVNISLDVSTTELKKLNADYLEYSAKGLKSPIYRLANSVTITINKNGKDYVSTLYNVGFRMKGNTSRQEFIDNDGQIYENIHLKLSFEETFSDESIYGNTVIPKEEQDYYANRKFAELSKIDLRYNKNQDASYIKEYYALNMFRDFGILSQNANFGGLTINQDGTKKINYGLYLITEPLTKTFIKRSLSSDNTYIGMDSYDVEKKGNVGVSGSKYGQLYKATYGIGPVTGAPDMTSSYDALFGVENEDTTVPPYELKTNTNNPDNTLIKNAFDCLNNGTYDEIANVIDLDYFYMYEAIATILGDPDDLRNNYNNYALYFRRTDGKMVIIPIDNDRALGTTKDWDPSGNAMSCVDPFSDMTSTNQRQNNNLYLKTILSNDVAKAKYTECLKKVLDSKWVTNDYFESIYNTVKTNYSEFVSTSLFNKPFSLNEVYNGSETNMSFREYIGKKITVINNALNKTEGENIIALCNSFYLTGTMDNWNKTTNEYKFSSIDSINYTFEMTIPNGGFECKIYTTDGNMWLRADNDSILVEGGSNIKFYDSTDYGKTIKFTINKETGKLHYEIY